MSGNTPTEEDLMTQSQSTAMTQVIEQAKVDKADTPSKPSFYPSARDNENGVGGTEDGEAVVVDEPKKKKKKKNKKKKNKGADQSEADTESYLSTSVCMDEPHRDQVGDPSFKPLKDVIEDAYFDDQDSSEDEGMPDYKIGGYHPVHVGEILLDRYIIIQKLGWGHFSTVWLTKDLKFNSYVAIKVQKSAQHYLEAAYDEVEILDQVAKNWRCFEWEKSIKEYYKDDPKLEENLK